jgi:hypothetical protein
MHEYQDLIKDFLIDLYIRLDIDFYTLQRIRFSSPNTYLIFRVGVDIQGDIYSPMADTISQIADAIHIQFMAAQTTHKCMTEDDYDHVIEEAHRLEVSSYAPLLCRLVRYRNHFGDSLPNNCGCAYNGKYAIEYFLFRLHLLDHEIQIDKNYRARYYGPNLTHLIPDKEIWSGSEDSDYFDEDASIAILSNNL